MQLRMGISCLTTRQWQQRKTNPYLTLSKSITLQNHQSPDTISILSRATRTTPTVLTTRFCPFLSFPQHHPFPARVQRRAPCLRALPNPPPRRSEKPHGRSGVGVERIGAVLLLNGDLHLFLRGQEYFSAPKRRRGAQTRGLQKNKRTLEKLQKPWGGQVQSPGVKVAGQ